MHPFKRQLKGPIELDTSFETALKRVKIKNKNIVLNKTWF